MSKKKSVCGSNAACDNAIRSLRNARLRKAAYYAEDRIVYGYVDSDGNLTDNLLLFSADNVDSHREIMKMQISLVVQSKPENVVRLRDYTIVRLGVFNKKSFKMVSEKSPIVVLPLKEVVDTLSEVEKKPEVK